MSNVAETIGDRFRLLRGGDTQASFSAKLGVHKDLVGKYERNESVPGGDFLTRMREVLGADINWLLTGEGSPYPSELPASTSAASPAPAEPTAETMRVQLDEELNARVVDGISRLYKAEGVGLSPMDLGRLAAKIYADLVNGFEPDERLVALKGILSQIRRQLRDPIDPVDAAQTKRSA